MVLAHNINVGQRTQDVRISLDVTFDTMLLSQKTLQGLINCGFFRPSPIQLHGIPLGKCGFDLILEAKSGTGKTAVFSIIALEKLDFSKGLQVIILAPTREIAAQVCDVLRQIGCAYKDLEVEVVMGGLPVQDDINKFVKNVNIVVASPGRLKHLMQDKHIDVSAVRLVVLDEADKLMEKSFESDVKYIYSHLPYQKQTILSSATYPESSKIFIKEYVKNAQHICPDSTSILLGIEQKITVVKHNSNIIRQTQIKFEELLKILAQTEFKQCLIFCNYQARVSELHKMLSRKKWPSEQLYGQQDQLDRLEALKTLQQYKCRILVSTDLAARGIDASNVDLVINFETPYEWQIYLHRIGRAGRFGAYGTAITILSEGVDKKKFEDLLISLKFPINITYLWDSEKFNDKNETAPAFSKNSNLIETSETQPRNTISECDELWKLLTSEKEETVEIESFADLCKSYDKVKDMVESFSDLLSSYQNYSCDIKESQNNYLHVEMDATMAKEFMKTIQSLKSQTDGLEDIIKSPNISATDSSIQIRKIMSNREDSISEINANLQKSSLNDITIKNVNEIENYARNECYDHQNNLNQEDCLHTALLQAGLPVSFSSTKQNNKTLHHSNNIHHLKKIDNNSGTSKYIVHPNTENKLSQGKVEYTSKYIVHPNTENKLSQGKVEYSSRRSKQNYRKDKIGTNNEIIDSENHIDEKHYDQVHKFHNKREKHLNNHNYRPKKYVTEQNDVSDSYTNWYNNLKFKMRQLELSFYIEEMSKF